MQAHQFNLRLILLAMATCGVAFATCAQVPVGYLSWAAACIPAFWAGLGVAFLGSALEHRYESWLMPAVLIGVCGVLVCMLSIFTGVFYTVIAVVDVAI